MEHKEEHIAKFEKTLQEISTRLDELKVQASLGKAEARDEIEKQISSLQEQQARAEKKLDELRVTGEGAWQEMKLGIDTALEDIKTGIKSAVDRLK